jgi:hypothetical protein
LAVAVGIGLYGLSGQRSSVGSAATSPPTQAPNAGPIAGNGQPTLIWTGATPEDIDRNLADPIERQLAAVDGLDYLSSSALEGLYQPGSTIG